MPIYEYQCKKCDYKFEQLQKISDKSLSLCPQCKKPQLVKLVSNTSFQLKGGGWYVTDFKNSKTENKKSTTASETTNKKKETKPVSK